MKMSLGSLLIRLLKQYPSKASCGLVVGVADVTVNLKCTVLVNGKFET